MLDDYKSWIDYVRTVGNKLVKNTGLLYHVSQLNYLNQFSYLKQKDAVRIVFNSFKASF